MPDRILRVRNAGKGHFSPRRLTVVSAMAFKSDFGGGAGPYLIKWLD
jgi:hypothetical protein